jgi:hypothetical protein
MDNVQQNISIKDEMSRTCNPNREINEYKILVGKLERKRPL